MGRNDMGDGARIRAVRTGLDMTQEAFSAKLGIAVSTLRNWEAGSTVPAHFMALVTLLERDPARSEEIFGQDGEDGDSGAPSGGGLDGKGPRRWADAGKYRHGYVEQARARKLVAIDRLLADPSKARMTDIMLELWDTRGDMLEAAGTGVFAEGTLVGAYIALLLERILDRLDGAAEPRHEPEDVLLAGGMDDLDAIEADAFRCRETRGFVRVGGGVIRRLNRFQADGNGTVCRFVRVHVEPGGGEELKDPADDVRAMDLAMKVLMDAFVRLTLASGMEMPQPWESVSDKAGKLVDMKALEGADDPDCLRRFAAAFGLSDISIAGLAGMGQASLRNALVWQPFEEIVELALREAVDGAVLGAISYLKDHILLDTCFFQTLLELGGLFGGMRRDRLDGFLNELYGRLEAVELPGA